MTKIQTKTSSYVVHYPEAIKFAEMQEGIFWTANEIDVNKDIMDLRVHMTEAERHGVITTLKLFTLYELIAGDEYWLGRVKEAFPRPEIQRMCSVFGMFELNVHAPFYNKLNQALMLDTEDFYNDYVNSPVLKERMGFIDSIVSDPSDLVSLGVFSLIEGVVLYSSFAFLKHFQTKGKNKLLNVVRGINMSLRDENIHALAGSWLYRSLRDEQLKEPPTYGMEIERATDAIVGAARAIYEHETQIIDMIFEKGEIEGITSEQMKKFVQGRINLCLSHLGIPPIFEVMNDTIAEWFYDNINSLSFGDFFVGVNNEYNRDWSQEKFKWN
jgi:ribonucleotide reductase beta subunit family protein with ferritin-like domain